MVAVNEEYAEETAPVKAGDIVAFIPPVSGASTIHYSGFHENKC